MKTYTSLTDKENGHHTCLLVVKRFFSDHTPVLAGGRPRLFLNWLFLSRIYYVFVVRLLDVTTGLTLRVYMPVSLPSTLVVV